MYADVSKISFRLEKSYSGVVAQQGRVTLDAEVNEHAAIRSYLARVFAVDLIGPHGGPHPGTGFAVGYQTPEGEPADLTIDPGHYYVDGLLVDATKPPALTPVPDGGDGTPPEAATQWTYWTQPYAYLDSDVDDDHLPDPPFLVYLRVWERFVSAVEDPDLRETALGATLPDTAGRLRVVWQIRAVRAKDLPLEGDPTQANLRTAFQKWTDARQVVQSRLAFGTQRPHADDDPCTVHPDFQFRGENSLYRVEIHTPGPAAKATFKWSRDNGSVVFPAASIAAGWVTLSAFGHDDKLDLHVGDVVEVVDDAYTAQGLVAPLLRVVELDLPARRVRLSGEPAPGVGHSPARHPYLRRWDHGTATGLGEDGAVKVKEGSWIDLEDGVQVWFGADGTYRSGEYWTVAARTLTGMVEWPRDEHGTPLLLPPAGPRSGYAPLAWVGGESPLDLRMAFPALAVPIEQIGSSGG